MISYNDIYILQVIKFLYKHKLPNHKTMYNIFTYLKANRASQTNETNQQELDIFQPLPSKKEPIDYDQPIPNRDTQ